MQTITLPSCQGHTVPQRAVPHCSAPLMPSPMTCPSKGIGSRGSSRGAGAKRQKCSSRLPERGQRRLVRCQDSAVPQTASARVAMEGDTVTLSYICRDEEGQTVDESDPEEPVTFEVGAGGAVGNPLYQAFDEAVRGMPLGESVSIEAKGGEWKRDLLFDVPTDHPEVQRLQGRYRNQGGLVQGMLVELANGSVSLVASIDDKVVRLDANNMMAGKSRTFELTLLSVEPPAP